MYKSITNIFAIGAIALSLTACSNDNYEGDTQKMVLSKGQIRFISTSIMLLTHYIIIHSEHCLPA